jgi:hypothetical protein
VEHLPRALSVCAIYCPEWLIWGQVATQGGCGAECLFSAGDSISWVLKRGLVAARWHCGRAGCRRGCSSLRGTSKCVVEVVVIAWTIAGIRKIRPGMLSSVRSWLSPGHAASGGCPGLRSRCW